MGTSWWLSREVLAVWLRVQESRSQASKSRFGVQDRGSRLTVGSKVWAV